ncbi:MAG: tetratricopeptide repeat protein [Terriglobales bacterium]
MQSRTRWEGLAAGLTTCLLLCGCARHPRQAAQALLAEAHRYEQRGKPKAAVIEIRRALQLAPRSLPSYQALARLELRQQHWTEAYAALHEIVSLDPNQAQAWLDLGRLYMRSQEWNHARDAAATVLRLQPDNAAAYQLLAVIAAARHDPATAARALARVTVLRPRDPDAWVNLALAEAGQQQTAPALADLHHALALDPHSSLAWVDLASLERTQPHGGAAVARATLAQSLRVNPRSVTLWLTQAGLDYDPARPQAAQQDIATLLARQPRAPAAALAAGQFWARRGDWPAAVAVEQAALRNTPSSVPLREQLLNAYVHTRAWNRAHALAAQLLQLQPGDLAAQLAQMRVRIVRGQALQTLQPLRQLAQQHPTAAAVLYTLALAEARAGQTSEALHALAQAAGADPHCASCLALQSQLWLAQGQSQASRRYARQFLATGADPAAAHRLLGAAELAGGQVQAALRDFQAAGLAQSSQPGDHQLLGDAAVAAGQLALARQQYQRALALLPAASSQRVSLVGRLVHVDAQHGDWKAAAAAIAAFAAANPHDAAGPWLQATLDQARGHSAPARAELHRALQLQPDFLQADLGLGRLQQQAGHWQRAVYWYQRALRQQPGFAPLWTVVGNLYRQHQQLAQAQQDYQRALAAQPGFVLAEANLAWTEAALHQNLNAALALAQKAAHAAPGDASVQDTLAWVYYKLGSYQAALPILRHCVARAPRSPLYHFHLGMTQFAAGQKHAAAAQLRRALALHLPAAAAAQARRTLAAGPV